MGIGPDAFLQLDDVVALERGLPDGRTVKIYGMVSQVRARHEGASLDSDLEFLHCSLRDGVADACTAALFGEKRLVVVAAIHS